MSEVETKYGNKIEKETSALKMSKESEYKFDYSGSSDIEDFSEESSENISYDEEEIILHHNESESLKKAKADGIFWYFYSYKLERKRRLPLEQLIVSPYQWREKFIKKLMGAFKFGPIFDTFCFSLPRPKQLENGYKQSVKNVENILLQCKNGLIKSIIVDFPKDSSKQMAEKLIKKLNRKLGKEENSSSVIGGATKGDNKPVDPTVDKNSKDGTCNKSGKTKATDSCADSHGKSKGKRQAAKKGCTSTDKVQSKETCKGKGKKRCAETGDNAETEVKKMKPSVKRTDPTEKDKVSDEDLLDACGDSDEYNSSDDDCLEYEDEFNDMTEEEVIDCILGNTFPHSLVHMLSDGKINIFSSWCGQIQCRVNMISKTLSILMYDYEPMYDDEICHEILEGKFTRPVAKAVGKQIEKFECCRLMRMDIQLNSLKELSVVHRNNKEMILYSKLIPSVKIFQRFINTSARDRSKWKERQPFLPFEGKCFTECSQEYMFVLGGSLSEISDIVAQIMRCNPTQRLDMNPKELAMSELVKKIEQDKGKKDYSLRHKDVDKKFTTQVDLKQRNKILDILKKYGLISKQVHNELKGTVKVSEVQGQVKIYNCLDDLNLHACSKDFINFKCDDVALLEKHLKSKLEAGEYGHEMKDLELKNPEKYDFDELTVAEFLTAEKMPNGFRDIFYSFCRSCPEPRDNTYHCSVCKQCMDWRNWHCPVCNKCAYGLSDPLCEYCGFKQNKNKIVIQPSTYYTDELWSSSVSTVVKKEWNVKLSTTDVPTWAQQIDVNKGPKKELVVKDYLSHDDLGFLNLWNLAFCIPSYGPRKYVNRYLSERYRWHIEMDASSFTY